MASETTSLTSEQSFGESLELVETAQLVLDLASVTALTKKISGVFKQYGGYASFKRAEMLEATRSLAH